MAAAVVLWFRALIPSCFLRSTPPPAPVLEAAPALEDDDILLEILIRLPPLPSSLLRASLICKRWHRLISDAGFLRRFRAHHPTPPLLGFFTHRAEFRPLLRPPDRIPSERFSLPQPADDDDPFSVLGFRHGLGLLINRKQMKVIVWDPITGCQRTVPYAQEFRVDGGPSRFHGAVLTAAEGDGSLSPFKVVLMHLQPIDGGHVSTSVTMRLYESATGKWSDANSTVIPSSYLILPRPNVLVKNSLCGFFLWPTGILEFDLDTSTVGVIQKPNKIHSDDSSFFRVVRTEDEGLGLAVLSTTIIKLWGRKASHNSNGALGWVLEKTVELDKLFPLTPTTLDDHQDPQFTRIKGYDEDNNVIHVAANTGVFAIQLGSLHCTKLFSDDRRCEEMPKIKDCMPKGRNNPSGVQSLFPGYCSGAEVSYASKCP